MNVFLVWSQTDTKMVESIIKNFDKSEGVKVDTLAVCTSRPRIFGPCDLHLVHTNLNSIQLSSLHFCKAYRNVTNIMK